MAGKDAASVASLRGDFSLEMTGKDIDELPEAATQLPPGTRVNVTSLASESLSLRLAAARAVRDAGLLPVPHVAARRLSGEAELTQMLSALQSEGLSERVFVIGGDPRTPHGPYGSALDVIRSGLLAAHGVREVGIAGYPDGHPDISDEVLWSALHEKIRALHAQGITASVTTQFGFDEAPILTWLTRVRERGIDCTVRIGIPGPTNLTRLLGFARRFGIASSAGIVRKYGLSMTNLVGSTGPDRLLGDLARGYLPQVHGDVRLHLYTFGGLVATTQWLQHPPADDAPSLARRRED